MAIFKCKMCGGDLSIAEGITIAECEYCGTKQTVPTVMDENLQNLFNRANTLRIKSEFDKAEKLYEKIIQADSTQAEAYWGLILCKYGIEYVDDPATFKRIPTCHRASYDSVVADDDYKAALENADTNQRALYEEQAKEIDEIQKGILALAQKEETYDVFICYKETDEDGKRTIDSTIANDIYYQLTQEGFKVFYAAITLEGKLGSAYEPIIFAALNSAKVMLSIGTKPEYFNAVWVKNEWSRFLKIIKKDRSKLLIPCYRDMDAYELPEEFSHLQAQDMAKIGFINDLVRGIKKVIVKDEPKTTQESVIVGGNANTAPLLKRAFMFLEDGDWSSANEYCEKVLDIDPENAEAYLGKLLAELNIKNKVDLKNCTKAFKNNSNYQKAVRFADDKLSTELQNFANQISVRAETARKDAILADAKSKMKKGPLPDRENAAKLFKSIPGWKDADELLADCLKKIEELKNQEKARQLAREQAEEARKKKKKLKRSIILSSISTILLLLFVFMSFDFKAIKLVTAKDLIAVDAGTNHTVGLKNDGTVIANGKNYFGQCNISDWTNIIAISADGNQTIGLKKDGTVIAAGEKENKACHVSKWTDIIAVSTNWLHTVGLKKDGTVVATGNNDYGQCDVSEWTDIIAISAGRTHTVGLKKDGTVVATGQNFRGQCDVSGWTNIVAISAGYGCTVGLKNDGTVVAVGLNGFGSIDLSDWTDITAISTSAFQTVGLKKDGTVVATGFNYPDQLDVVEWKNIASLSADHNQTIGLKKDGSIVSAGYRNAGSHVWLGFFGRIEFF